MSLRKGIADIEATIKVDDFSFQLNPPAKIDDIEAFEKKHSIQIPAIYREWLMFSDGGCLFDSKVQFYGVKQKPVIEIKSEWGLPDEYITIGAMNWGDPICFLRSEQKILMVSHEGGGNDEYKDFGAFLEYLVKLSSEK